MYWGEDDRRSDWYASHYRLTLVTGPSDEVITLDDAKAHAKIAHGSDNEQLLAWIAAATRKVEHDTEMALLTQTWDLAVRAFPSPTGVIALPLRPVQSVTSVTYYSGAGAPLTLSAGQYALDASLDRIALTFGGSWPTDLWSDRPAVVRFIAGYASPADVPEDLKLAVKLLVTHYSEERQPAREETLQPVPFGYEDVIRPYVRYRAA